jgi:hypothetical protein
VHVTENTFSRVEETDKRLYGPRKLLVCGYAAEDQAALRTMLAGLNLADLPLVFAATAQLEWHLKRLLELPAETGLKEESDMRRAVIMSGISEKELHMLLGGYRARGLPAQLWATLTPVTEAWPLRQLLDELAAEHEAMIRRQAAMQAQAAKEG